MPKMNVTREIIVKADVEKLHKVLSDFKQWVPWSPWLIAEPEAQVTFKDEGKKYAWKGEIVGEGNMSIKDNGKQKIVYDLQFLKPWKSKAETSFILTPKENDTLVTWTLDSSLPFFLFWMKKQMEGFVGMDYERGLKMLKEYVETGNINSSVSRIGQQNVKGFQYLGVKNNCTFDNVGMLMDQDIQKLKEYLKKSDTKPEGKWFTIYNEWDLVNKKGQYITGIPMSVYPADCPDHFEKGNMPDCKVFKIEHKGVYEHLGNGWAAAMMSVQNIKGLKQNKKIKPFEVYENEYGKVPDNELLTTINIPLK